MLQPRPWLPGASRDLEQRVAAAAAGCGAQALDAELQRLVRDNRRIHGPLRFVGAGS